MKNAPRTVNVDTLVREAASYNRPHKFTHDEVLQGSEKDKFEEALSPPILDLLHEKISPGESAIVVGSTARLFLSHVAPIHWKKLQSGEQSDRDIVLLGEKSTEALSAKSKRNYLLERGDVGDGSLLVRYELLNGRALQRDIRTLALDLAAQAREQSENKPRVEMAAQAEKIVTLCDKNPESAVMANNLFPEMQLGIVVENHDGELRYRVSDPLNVLNRPRGINDTVELWNEEVGFAGGFLSQGIEDPNIHKIVMRLSLLDGSINSKSPMLAHTKRLILRQGRDEHYGVIFAADGIFHKATLDDVRLAYEMGIVSATEVAEIEERYRPLYAAESDYQLMRLFLAQQMKSEESEGLRTLAQAEFATHVTLDMQAAIFFNFSSLNTGNLLHPQFNESIADFRNAFGVIAQNTLHTWINRMLSEMLPEETMRAENGLRILRNVIQYCDILYPMDLQHDFGGKVSDHDQLPILTQKNSPSSMSEVMALLFLSSGNWEPTNEKLGNLVNSWRISGNAPSMYGRLQAPFDRGITIEGIREKIHELSVRLMPVREDFLSTEIPAPFAETMV